MKKILYTINFLTNGGPTRVLQNLLKELDLGKYDIYVLTIIDANDKKIVKELKEKGIKIIEFKFNKSLKEILKNKKKIINKILEVAPDIIHTHGIVTTVLINDKKVKAKKITTVHNSIFEDYKYTYGKIKGMIFAYIHIINLKKFDNVICCSKTSYDAIKKYLNNVSYIRNGIDIQGKFNENARKDLRRELNIEENAIVYIYGGVINSRKRVVELVELFNNELSNDEYLIIVGDGNLKNVAELARKNNNIFFTGFKKNIIDYFKAADVYVSYSSSEGFSISVIEALECGLLLLLSDIPSHKECFEIDTNYYLGEYFNESNFINKKNKIYINQILDKKSRMEFKTKYLSAKTMTCQYEKYY